MRILRHDKMFLGGVQMRAQSAVTLVLASLEGAIIPSKALGGQTALGASPKNCRGRSGLSGPMAAMADCGCYQQHALISAFSGRADSQSDLPGRSASGP